MADKGVDPHEVVHVGMGDEQRGHRFQDALGQVVDLAAVDKARLSSHLSTIDLNGLVDTLRPRFLLPLHFSKNYSGKSPLLYEELEVPSSVTLLHLPEHLTPRPLLTGEIPKLLKDR